MGMPTDLGIVDLGMGFPYRSIEEKKAAYDFFKANLKDRESLEEMEFPAQYMFKDVPDVVAPGVDPVQWIVEKMDAFNIEQCMTGLNDDSIRAKQEYPGRFHLMALADPNKGTETLRKMERLKAPRSSRTTLSGSQTRRLTILQGPVAMKHSTGLCWVSKFILPN